MNPTPHPDPVIALVDRKNARIDALQAQVTQLETDKASLTHALKIARSALRGAFSVRKEAVDFINSVLGPLESNSPADKESNGCER